MCGICGFVSPGGLDRPERLALESMCNALVHRGPDDVGVYASARAMLGMRRLSIIDLETGQQPISNEARNLWCIFNGEIYNFASLRSNLQHRGHQFSTRSDTEVIVHAYESFGAACVEQFNGMFALAIWDERERCLFLARDRLGIKPLYYWTDGEQLVFGSELKALLQHPAVPREVDLVALDQFLALEYIPAPRTILRDVHKLPPGHTLRFDAYGCRVERYWDIPEAPVAEPEPSLIERLRELIDDAVRLRLVSDVPLGAFLSGGIDSSTIVASMSRAMDRPVKTFSIGFGDETYNELPYARIVADRFGTQHVERFLKPDLQEMVLKLVAHLDEPLGDFSIFPTYLVSEVARQDVTVALSGDGGDELFGGYDTYVAQSMDRYYRLLPGPLRKAWLPALLERVPPRPAKKGLVNKAKRFVEGAALPDALEHARWMIFLANGDRAALYQPEVWAQLPPDSAVAPLERMFERAASRSPLARQQYVDVKTYLVDNILTKVDRMSMAASLEARVPLLDHRIVEFAFTLPDHMKMRNGTTKWILRAAMADRLPAEVLEKPKEGFSIPLKHWLRGPLEELMRDLLAPQSLAQSGFFRAETVQGWMAAHLQRRANHSHRLWALMVFTLWQRTALQVTP